MAAVKWACFPQTYHLDTVATDDEQQTIFFTSRERKKKYERFVYPTIGLNECNINWTIKTQQKQQQNILPSKSEINFWNKSPVLHRNSSLPSLPISN